MKWCRVRFLHQIQCRSRSRNRPSRSRHLPSRCRASPRRPATPAASTCGTPGRTAWSTCGTAAPGLHPTPPRPPIWWTWWVTVSRPAPPPPAVSLSPSSASTTWWTGPSARPPRTTPPVWWTWRPPTRWPSATSMHCSTRPWRGRTWMTDSCWWPTGRRCWKKGLRSDGLMQPLIQRDAVCRSVGLKVVFSVGSYRRARATSANHRRTNLANQRSPQLNLHRSFITSHQVRNLSDNDCYSHFLSSTFIHYLHFARILNYF